jgi:hypothetical protein
MNQLYEQKYLKYKAKYLALKKQIAGRLPDGRDLIQRDECTISRSFAEKVIAANNNEDNDNIKISIVDNTIMFTIKSLYDIRNRTLILIHMADAEYMVILNEILPIGVDNINNERIAVSIKDIRERPPSLILLSDLLRELGGDFLHVKRDVFFIKLKLP